MEREVKSGSGGGTPRGRRQSWLKVDGQSRQGYPAFIGTLRGLGGLVYLLMARDRQSGLLGYGVVAAGRLSRSSQPYRVGWRYLRSQGVRTLVNLRRTEVRVHYLRELGFSGYLHLPIPDAMPPTDAQAEAFLQFVTDPAHWPVHLHCLNGIQRSGTLVALFRYAVEGWTMEEALREANSYFPGPTEIQVRWLRQWAQKHPPAEWSRPSSP